MIASFPWYDLPSVRWANDAIWQATGLGGALDRDTPVEAQWRARDLAVSQACGLDLFLSDAPIEPVLAPVFELDCEEGCYYSYLVGDGSGVAAVNSRSSRSGLSTLLTMAAEGECRPTALVVTGSHRASLAAIREGSADMACIDAVTWGILERDRPDEVRGVRELARSSSAPAPPYVVREAARRDDVATRIVAAMTDPETLAARRALLIRGVMAVALDDYEPVRTEYQAVAASLRRYQFK